jgi:hypothetical protein
MRHCKSASGAILPEHKVVHVDVARGLDHLNLSQVMEKLSSPGGSN